MFYKTLIIAENRRYRFTSIYFEQVYETKYFKRLKLFCFFPIPRPHKLEDRLGNRLICLKTQLCGMWVPLWIVDTECQ